jgi:lipoprotein-anchoring transpeptidase ErfK/SrfK
MCAALAGAVAFMLPLAAAAQQSTPGPVDRRPMPEAQPKAMPPALPCGDIFGFQVLLDTQGFSAGEIDGKSGPNLSRALAAFQAARNLPVSGEADCATWETLRPAGPPTMSYAITEEDANGPFAGKIPASLADQAGLPALGYSSLAEQLAERFHTSPAMLQQLNSGARLEAGATIQVPAVQPFDASAPRPTTDPAAAAYAVTVSKDESSLRVTRADGTLVFFAPVTTGSEKDPLPPGNWKVNGVSWQPTFNYNPDLFWDAKRGDAKATLQPGPNNPVGIVWIDIDVEHYGLHGTPEPGRVGHAESHGCVRLTNWDAARLAALVKPGTPVQFK